MVTSDYSIRGALIDRLQSELQKDPKTKVLSEVEVCMGYARVDVMLVNGILHGYEIKSDKDSLDRLAHQAGFYEQVFEKITVVCGERHLERAINELSPWWGVLIAKTNRKGVRLTKVRTAKLNPIIDPYSLVQLLWKEEALQELAKRGLDKGVRSKPRNIIWERLVESLPLSELCGVVRECIKNRNDWRIDVLPR